MKTKRNAQGVLKAQLNLWSVGQSFLTAAALSVAVITHTLRPLLLSGAVSFASFFIIGFKHIKRKNLFTLANLMTALRLGLVFFLGILFVQVSNWFVFGAGLILMLLDCVDGWLARRTEKATLWGEFFDKETDAFFLLLICLAAVQKNLAGLEILVVGALRYVFILSLFVFKQKPIKEEKSLRAQFIFTFVLMVVLSLYLPLDYPRFPFVMLALVLIFFSFGADFRKTATAS